MTKNEAAALIADCERVLLDYPEQCPERGKIERQVELLKRKHNLQEGVVNNAK